VLNVFFVAAAQFMFDRTRQPKMSAFFDEENDIAEEDESNRESSKKVQNSEICQQLGLSEVDEARLRSCLEGIHNVIGDSVPEQILIDAVLRNEFNLNKALDAVLSNAASAAENPPAGEFGAGSWRRPRAVTCVVLILSHPLGSLLKFWLSCTGPLLEAIHHRLTFQLCAERSIFTLYISRHMFYKGTADGKRFILSHRKVHLLLN
jgi:hypothetical protein